MFDIFNYADVEPIQGQKKSGLQGEQLGNFTAAS